MKQRQKSKFYNSMIDSELVLPKSKVWRKRVRKDRTEKAVALTGNNCQGDRPFLIRVGGCKLLLSPHQEMPITENFVCQLA